MLAPLSRCGHHNLLYVFISNSYRFFEPLCPEALIRFDFGFYLLIVLKDILMDHMAGYV